jgi:hypothetical protein
MPDLTFVNRGGEPRKEEGMKEVSGHGGGAEGKSLAAEGAMGQALEDTRVVSFLPDLRLSSLVQGSGAPERKFRIL